MKKFLQISLIFCLLVFVSLFQTLTINFLVQAEDYTWEEIREKNWEQGDALSSDDFNTIINKLIEMVDNNNYSKFLSIFSVVVNEVKKIEEKFASISSDVNGNIGIGTETPNEKLEVNGKIVGTPIMGNWYPSQRFLNQAAGTYQEIILDKEFDVTAPSYFTNLGESNGIQINKDGYYHIECVTLVYLESSNDYGHLFLFKNNERIDLNHSHAHTYSTWDDRSSSWKGFVKAGDRIRASVYHQYATPNGYIEGPVYTRLTIQKLN